MKSRTQSDTLTDQSKAVSLFQFIRELNKLKQKPILNIGDYPWVLSLENLPDDPENIRVFYRDRVEDNIETEEEPLENVLLSVHKPEFQECPKPAASFKNWLKPGWDYYHNQAKVFEYIELEPNKRTKSVSDSSTQFDAKTSKEFFVDSQQRVKDLEIWLALRSQWVEKQLLIEQTRNLFDDMYRYYFELQRESETEEIVVANGMLNDSNNAQICHPVLTHRVKMIYDADSNTVSIVDTDTPSELYSVLFQMMEDINLSGVSKMSDLLQENDYHPLDRNDTPGYLKVLVHQLSSDSRFSKKPPASKTSTRSRLQLYLFPCFIVRKRLDGTLKAIERIIEDIQERGNVPKPIRDIVSGGLLDIPTDTDNMPIEERLAAVGGESIDILLSKEANKEQLDIARRIDQYDAVLVQGPPGTGKTHTIANLMGHLLSQGKSVLVTSYTKKALSVLKEKVAPGLQDLCVSMLDDSNMDMEKSVDGIISFTSRTTSYEVKRKMETLAADRNSIAQKLASVRKEIYSIISQESTPIVVEGQEISPSQAAAFVTEHEEDLSYIPGKVRLRTNLPLSFEQLVDLYRSNEGISESEEKELDTDLPNPKDLMSPNDFEALCTQYQQAVQYISDKETQNAWTINNDEAKSEIYISGEFGEIILPYPEQEALEDLRQYSTTLGKIDDWMKSVAVDGNVGGSYAKRWEILTESITKTCELSGEYIALALGKRLSIQGEMSLSDLEVTFKKLRDIFEAKGKISKLTLMLHKSYEQALSAVTINDKRPNSADDCALILKYIELIQTRTECGNIWNELLTPHKVPAFEDLADREPETIAANWIQPIHTYLNWYNQDYGMLLKKLEALKIPSDTLFKKDMLDSDLVATDKILTCVERTIPEICDTCNAILKRSASESAFISAKQLLTSGKLGNSAICQSLVTAINQTDPATYATSYADLEATYEKYRIQTVRREYLKTLQSIAPEWAHAIKNREGVHGSHVIPSTLEDAWKWKQLCGIIDEMTKQPFSKLQAKSLQLSREYRKITASYAEMSGWYHLLRKTEADISMKQALEGWRLTVKSIGKGTGKRAPMLKAKARELMAQCQQAVPCWIMPINKALESLDPRVNKFDVIIIDEASQSDVSSLAILYMGKKLVIVGDDKQVSPMAVGVLDRKVTALQEQYIKDKIPNDHLYTAKTSIYDISKTTFQPLMLREHFRCVPEIIGFSNLLSYDGKVQPLRDGSTSALLPAVINYRVQDGQRIGKTNLKEAEAIVALMQACFKQPEYKDKTFGVISLLGDDQVKLIQREIERKLKPQDIVSRNIMCGNPANFQGDERDVIFLSLVDSGNGEKTLALETGMGHDERFRKRYNVAVSRAKDQIWIVNSLDPTADLKADDIRKRLLDYANDPNAQMNTADTFGISTSKSLFEDELATDLIHQGYHLARNWHVGSYLLNIVAVYGDQKVAIECDGERLQGGEEKIREDMERQTILERLGWRFIRIRGSEFYRNRTKSVERIAHELDNFGIKPEDTSETETHKADLYERVTTTAAAILKPKEDSETENE